MVGLMKYSEKILKRFLSGFVAAVLPDRSQHRQPDLPLILDRVLVFRLDNRLGNALLLLPLIQSIHRSNPSIKVDVLMTAQYCEVYNGHPAINRVIPYNQTALLKNPLRFLRFLRQLRRYKYDAVFSSSNPNTFSLSQAIFARLVSFGYTVGFKWKNSEDYYSHAVAGNTDIHYSASQVDLWRVFDPDAVVENPRTYFSDSISVPQNDKILFWLGATGNKILEPETVDAIYQVIQEQKTDCDIAAGPHDRELSQRYSGAVREKLQFRTGTLLETAQFYRQYSMIIIPDTGPMHLAVALGLPVVQVFRESNTTWYGYTGENLLVLNGSDGIGKIAGFIEKYTN
jgi:heptosyltransferase-3